MKKRNLMKLTFKNNIGNIFEDLLRSQPKILKFIKLLKIVIYACSNKS